jgi:hypothetical protein
MQVSGIKINFIVRKRCSPGDRNMPTDDRLADDIEGRGVNRVPSRGREGHGNV